MKQRKLASFLAITLSLELIIAPVISHAQMQGQMQGQANPAQTLNAGLQALGSIWSAANNNFNSGMTSQMANDMQALGQQQSLQPDKYFNPQKLSRIPGLGDYLAINNINPNMLDCKTLPTTLHEARPEVCRLGVTNDRNMHPSMQLDQMLNYYNQYFQVSKMYKNFTADSNTDGQAFGVGCMNNAMQILNGFFKYRMDELDKLTTNLEALNNQFREASRADLDAIEETVAVLDGNSPLADKVRSRKPELFDFSKRFNNRACNSMFAGETLNDMGRSNGLNAINRDLQSKLNDKGSGRYSGQSYSEAHTAVVEDIQSVADKMAKQVELNFPSKGNDPRAYADFLKGAPGLVSSTSRVQESITMDMFADVQTKFTEKFAKISENRSVIQSELPSAGRALSMMGSLNQANFEAEVNTLENNIKNNCLQQTLGSAGSRKDLMNKIFDPSASKHANKNASNFLKDKLNQILDDPNTSIEKKLADLKAVEKGQGSRYYMRMENAYEVQELDANGNIQSRTVEASSVRSPSVYFSDIIKNCNAQFKANKLNNKLTGQAAIKEIRKLNNDFKALGKAQAADIKKEIKKRLIDCESPEIANNSIPGSCGPGLFNPASSGFCAKAALSCSKNMQACTKQAEGIVKKIRDEKTARVNNYKALAQKNKMDIVKIFDSALTRYMKEGEMMRGLFGAGFASPAGVLREVPENQRYLSDFANATGKPGSPDGKLLLEDPDKYVEMFKKNIALLKDSVKKQQDQILGGDSVQAGGKNPGLLAAHIELTKKNYQAVVTEAEKTANTCLASHDSAVQAAAQQQAQAQAENMKMMNELGEHQREYCRRFSLALGGHPGPACSGNLDDIASALGNSSYELQVYCDGAQNTSGSSAASRARQICDGNEVPADLVATCKKWEECDNRIVEIDSTGSEEKRPVKIGCEQDRTDGFVQTVLASSGQGAVLSAESAPFYCNAGDNSGPGNIMKGFHGFSDAMNQYLGGPAGFQ
jgi:hypothetical protein